MRCPDAGPHWGAASRGAERGSATIWVLAAAAVILLAGMTCSTVGAAVVARHRAGVAADFGALAGALQRQAGSTAGAACAAAARIAAANRARLTGCVVEGPEVVVTAQTEPAVLAALAGVARVTARAGPARPYG